MAEDDAFGDAAMSAALTKELADALDLAAADFDVELSDESGDAAAAGNGAVAAVATNRQPTSPQPPQNNQPQPAVKAEAAKPQHVTARPAGQAPRPQANAAVPSPNAEAPKPQPQAPQGQNAQQTAAQGAKPQPNAAAPANAEAKRPPQQPVKPAAQAQKAPQTPAQTVRPQAQAASQAAQPAKPQQPAAQGSVEAPARQAKPAAPAAQSAQPQAKPAAPTAQATAPKPQQTAIQPEAPVKAAPQPVAAKAEAPKPQKDDAASTAEHRHPSAKEGKAAAAAATAASFAFDDQFEKALLGLSEPANPRQSAIHHAEAFAPDRKPVVAEDDSSAQVFDDFDELIASELAALKQPAPTAPAGFAEAASDEAFDSSDWPASFEVAGRAEDDARAQRHDDEDDELRASRPAAAVVARGHVGRSSFIGAGIGAIALTLAAGGAYFFMGGTQGTAGDGSVLIVRADPDPVKVKPENPGGRQIPNQNKMVYSRVESGDAIVTPEQKTLVSAEEAPIDLPTENPPLSDLPGVELGVGTANAADRQGDSTQKADAYSEASPIGVLSPRRAKTYSVRSDGTLVVSDAGSDAGADTSNRGPLIEASARPLATTQDIGTTADAASADGLQTASSDAQAPVEAASADQGVPAPNVPVPTIRPSHSQGAEPRDVAVAAAEPVASAQPAAAPENVEPIRTAAIEAQPATAASAPASAPVHDGYYVQISSQPSRDAAEASSRNLTQRYSSVIAGRNVVIQSADIPGKGTYYRVRVPVDSKTEGGRLCGDLKSAGGSCFVSR
ncbi:SPOR domain-containing protein [Jiella mangrovi]|uniref:SPOR domain-containing protein n=1 Tax=Jiella mangrovi TaxID=2821407 RepID=A0ABS4BEU3_9HYPH|nr:SPOR domain-containing protein [Jiella mangrovi]MBP0615268.1 SPOR domain-containing protein [Jiella mangrovi]